MKRFLILVLAALGLSTVSFADNSSTKVTTSFSNSFIHKMNNKTTFEGIADFLDMSYHQKDVMRYIFSEAQKVMTKESEKGASVKEAAEKAIYFNLGNARQVLSRGQYLKFVGLINLTVYNENNDQLLYE
ncbi:hypothetical protein [Bacteroides sedimenti]|uniref:Uncharacterized protein n=1 Tax=Bacteroides sedimenti TaxID=2136147 RepID=A0ABN6Z280_9BACE